MMDELWMSRLKDPDLKVRLEALERLGAAPRDPDTLACLIDRLKDEAPEIRTRARQILKNLTRRDFGLDLDEWQRWWKENASIQCNQCKRWLFDHTLYYRAQARLTSEPKELIITEEDLKKDHQAEVQKICEEMSGQKDTDIADEVYVILDYFLCMTCKKGFVQEIRKGPILDPAG